MKRLPNASQRLMLALLVGIIAVPITSTALFIKTSATEGLGSLPESLREQAMGDRRMLRARRRMYWQAVEQFEHANRTSDDAIMPDINDPDSIQRALNQNNQGDEVVHEAAPIVSTLTTGELLMQDRLLLRRYTRARFCPEGLKDFRVPGFYDLCVGLVGSSVSRKPVIGLLNHSAYLYRTLRGAAPTISAFKLRMQMVEEANDPSNRRDPGIIPGRPTTCVMNPNCLVPRSDQD